MSMLQDVASLSCYCLCSVGADFSTGQRSQCSVWGHTALTGTGFSVSNSGTTGKCHFSHSSTAEPFFFKNIQTLSTEEPRGGTNCTAAEIVSGAGGLTLVLRQEGSLQICHRLFNTSRKGRAKFSSNTLDQTTPLKSKRVKWQALFLFYWH